MNKQFKKITFLTAAVFNFLLTKVALAQTVDPLPTLTRNGLLLTLLFIYWDFWL